MQATGRISKLFLERGFGFVSDDFGVNKRLIFFHATGLKDLPWDAMLQSQRVSFEIVNTDKGPQAVNVRARHD